MRVCREIVRRSALAAVLLCGGMVASPVAGQTYQIHEANEGARCFSVSTEIKTQGKVRTVAAPGKTQDLPLQSTAAFAFRERRLGPAGRDARALRAVRDFTAARVTAKVGDHPSDIALPNDVRLIVASGRREGMINYCPRALLTRDQVDLLEMPGDPLLLQALLPTHEVELNKSWTVPEWLVQVLSGVEAIETASMSGVLKSMTGNEAVVEVDGRISGLREGAKTNVAIRGTVTCRTDTNYLSAANLTYTIEGDVGSVAPGMEATVTVKLTRAPTQEVGPLTDALLAAIPVEPPAEALRLVFDATPWQTRLLHSRDWFVFHAVLDQPPKVAILRLVEQGSLVCQCNISPIPDAAPGTQTPIDQFQRDIKNVLGDAFRGFKSQQTFRTGDGRMVAEVIVSGEARVQKEDGAYLMPMEWRYYLLTDPNGRQISFVFALDPNLVAQLAGRDRQLVNDLEFLPVKPGRR